MCGIAGWLVPERAEIAPEVLDGMAGAIRHRGPDDSGYYRDPSSGVSLAHRRLSIIDLSDASHQPMVDAARKLALVYNGELYNFRELRGELQSRGRVFRSSGDTEVVLQGYVEWGSAAFQRFRGMFALALWDGEKNVLHLVRDPLGIKPLYYWCPPRGGIVFASEVKAFLALPDFRPAVNQKALRQFLEFGYTFAEADTILEGVRKLAPGQRIEVRGGRVTAMIGYHTPNLTPYPHEKSDDIEDRLHGTLAEVVQQHLVADVPVGMLLSGGLDSSLVASLAARCGDLRTFSFGFAGSPVDERPHARRVAEHIGSRHEEILIQPDEIVEDLEGNVRYFDDLFADWGMITTRLLYKKCRERGIKVVLVGEGSDELFGGYDIFKHALPERSQGPLEWQLFLLYRAYAGRRYGTQYPPFRRLMKRYLNATGGCLFSAIRLFESRNQLPNNYVMKVDKASMSVGVEARVPYLDLRIADIAYRIPRPLLLDGADSKLLLKRMARRHRLLPEETLARRKFGAGIAMNWIEDDPAFRDFAKDAILGPGSWVDQLGLRKAMELYFNRGKPGYAFPRAISIFRNLAWRLLQLNLWSRHYLPSPVI